MYFDIFQYPLTQLELKSLHPAPEITVAELEVALSTLQQRGVLQLHDGFYQLTAPKSYADRRKAGNALAAKRMLRAAARARLVASFPFVEAVMISGSLSKNYMEAGSDIDFFVVTRPGRLWIARTLLIAFKKIFLFNSHKDFCLNYFIDTDHLEIEDKNIFTATEVAYLLPMHNAEIYKRFRATNAWADAYYPHFGERCAEACRPVRRGPLRRAAEWLLGGRIGEALDARFMRLTINRWQQKFNYLNNSQFEVAMRSRKYVSKHHPQAFQERVIGKLQERQAAVEQRLGQALPFQAAMPL